MKKSKIVLPFFISVIILIIIYFIVYKDVQLLGGLKTSYDNTKTIHKAESFIQNLNIRTENLQRSCNLQANPSLIRQVQNEFGYKKGNELLRDSVPGYSWRVNWNKTEKSNVSFGMSVGEGTKEPTLINVVYDGRGNLIEFSKAINDSAEMYSPESEEARIFAIKFLSPFYKFGNQGESEDGLDSTEFEEYSLISASGEVLKFRNEKSIIYPHRTDYFFTWEGKSSSLNDSTKVEVTVSGNIISSYKYSYIVPDKYTNFSSDIYQGILDVVFYLIIIILIASIAYKKIKAYEIGFKLAFIVSAVVAVMFGAYIYVFINQQMAWQIVFPLIFGPAFYGGAVFITWATGETISREVWKEKLNSIDLIVNGYFFNPKIGESILTGLSSGFAILIMQILFLLIAQSFTAVTSASYNNLLYSFLNTSNNSISAVSLSVFYPVFLVSIFLLFMVSGLRKRIKSAPALILISGIIYGLLNSSEIYPYYLNIILGIITGLLVVFIFYKFDVLASILSLSTLILTVKILTFFCIGNATSTNSGYFLILIPAMFAVYGFVSLQTKPGTVDLDAITPAFAKNVTERERLQRELEIAKEVQMSFLPRTNPDFPGLEIASRCVPALEVGGDYYDFVTTGDKKIGIIIGDVSGKGTQAAFYMTLTKGFLKALSRIAYTPANFLKELNSLFYENVERGTFISMAYGVLDMDNKVFTLARAGHNRIIVRNSSNGLTEFLNSSGLALGLEKGLVFSKTIQEVEIPFSSGDIIVFYTDGFTEAMNKLNEEFGENKLISSVESNSALSASQILENIFHDVQGFIGKADQHDDMTMVVVKVI